MSDLYGPLFAEVYDDSGQVFFGLKMIAYLQEVLAKEKFHGTTAVDLACGTGTLACAIAQLGWRAFGVDASNDMLKQSRKKAAELEVAVEFLQADLAAFNLPVAADLVTCVGDSLNYLTDRQALDQTFANVSRTMQPGGLFLFDLSTKRGLETCWGKRTYFRDDEDLALAVVGDFQTKEQELRITFTGFVRRGALYERFVEQHVMRPFSTGEITEALEAAGLAVAGRYDGFGFVSPTENSEREIWIARKG